MEDLNTLTLYKLIVLYMLKEVDFSLTKTQIFDFMLEKEYTDYFTLQTVMYQLTEDGLIESKSMHNSSHLSITEKGNSTIDYLGSCISEGIKEDIKAYLHDKDLQLRNEVSISADCYRTTLGEFTAELSARERNTEIVNIKITMPTESAALEICDNWQKKNQEVYAFLMEQLL